MLHIDTHHHLIPPGYRKALQKAGIDEAGGRTLPEWTPEAALQTMAELDIATAILSVSTPGTTFLSEAAGAAALARDLNDYTAKLVAAQPDRFGFFATVPMPHIDASVPKRFAPSMSCTPTASSYSPTTRAYISAKKAKSRCLPRSTRAQPWYSSIRPRCRVPPCRASLRLPPTFCWTPPVRHTCWCATASAAATPTSASSSATPEASCPMPATEWPWPSRAKPAAARRQSR
jgi:hypothetical protein